MLSLISSYRFFCLCLFLGLVESFSAYCQNDTIVDHFQLGQVEVGATAISNQQKIDSKQIRINEKDELSNALNLLPGVLNVVGAKTDMVYVRGFDLRQVPVYYDGIPIYIPYDGYIDLGMLMASDVSQITVSSGTESLLYGPNALGGAINIVTGKPRKGFTCWFKGGSFTNGKYDAQARLSFATDSYYLRAAYAIVNRNDYRLSSHYKPTSSLEDGGDLDNSWKKMAQYSVKVGYTPSDGNEYAISFVKHDGKKGISPYLGTDGSSRFWQFPVYDKESIYFLSNTTFGQSLKMKTRFYYDTFDNTLESYDDSTYSTQTKKYAFTSIYDDYTLGGIATLSYMKKGNTVVFDVQYKYDNHKEHDVGEPIQTMEDQSAAVSMIDSYSFSNMIIHGGLSMNYEKSIKAQYLDDEDVVQEYPDNSNTVLNGELSLLYHLTDKSEVKGGISYKTRFPTMKDRYSQSLGKSEANPDLKVENALNYTLDYTTHFNKNRIVLKAGLFYSKLKDAILKVYGVDASDDQIYQLQNTGKAEYYGGDFDLAYSILPKLLWETNYSYVIRNNLSSPDEKFTDVPKHSVYSALTYHFQPKFYINVNMEAYSNRYTTSEGTKVDGYALLNGKVSVPVYKMIAIQGGVNNMMDKDYEIQEGYPMMGRNAFASFIINF